MSKELEAIVAFREYCEQQAAPFDVIATLKACIDDGVKVEIDPQRLVDLLLSTQAGEGWRDISTAPKDGSYILASDGEHDGCAVVRWDCDGWVYAWHEYDGPMQMHSASHWRPLPPPPEAK